MQTKKTIKLKTRCSVVQSGIFLAYKTPVFCPIFSSKILPLALVEEREGLGARVGDTGVVRGVVATHSGGTGSPSSLLQLTNERKVLAALTVFTNERRVMTLLTNERRVITLLTIMRGEY